jgi:hypothetical protein
MFDLWYVLTFIDLEQLMIQGPNQVLKQIQGVVVNE